MGTGHADGGDGTEDVFPFPAGMFPNTAQGGRGFTAQGGRGFTDTSDRASEVMATSEHGMGMNGGTPTAFNTEAYVSEAQVRVTEKANVYLARINTLKQKVKKMVNSVKAILETTSDANHSRSITIDSLAGYSAMKADYTDQIRQVSQAMREEAWGRADLMVLADRADDALEEAMARGVEMDGTIDSYLAREFNVLNRLRSSKGMSMIDVMCTPDLLKQLWKETLEHTGNLALRGSRPVPPHPPPMMPVLSIPPGYTRENKFIGKAH